MTNVINFPEKHRMAEMIDALERITADVKANKIKFLGIAAVTDEGIARSFWTPSGPDGQTITQGMGAAAFLGARLSDAVLAGMEEVEDDGPEDPDEAEA